MKKQPQDTYLLVHGGFHGAWCWNKLKPLMEKEGLVVITPDHSGMGKEFQHYTDDIGALLEKQPYPVIILGHSSGGMVISELAKRYPNKIKGLIYLSAFLLPAGMSPPEIMQDDTISIMQSSLIIDERRGIVTVNKEKAKQLFYADCEDPVAQWAVERLTPEPIRPKMVKETDQTDMRHQHTIRRFYIETLNDKALGIISQRRMQVLSPCEKVYTLTSGHAPFLSQPGKLTTILVEISNSLSNK